MPPFVGAMVAAFQVPVPMVPSVVMLVAPSAGARVVSVLSWILTVGWETVLCVSAVYAVDAASDALFGGDATKNPGLQIVTLLIVAAIIVALGVFGFTWIMRAQLIITIVTASRP